LDFYRETTGDKQDLKLEPAPPPAPRAAAPDKTKPVEKPAKAREVYLQVGAFKTEKQAEEALKKVLAKGFKARLMKENNQLFRVLAGPYKESEVTLATKDLRAKGYKDVIRR
jgi:cell division protein FtsN